MPFAWSVIKFILYFFNVFIWILIKFCFFRNILSDQSIQIFIGSSFPWVIWMSKVKIKLQIFCNFFVMSEFFSVIWSHSLNVWFIFWIFSCVCSFFYRKKTNQKSSSLHFYCHPLLIRCWKSSKLAFLRGKRSNIDDCLTHLRKVDPDNSVMATLVWIYNSTICITWKWRTQLLTPFVHVIEYLGRYSQKITIWSQEWNGNLYYIPIRCEPKSW